MAKRPDSTNDRAESGPEADKNAKNVARLTMTASANAAAVMDKYTANIFGETSFVAMVDDLAASIEDVQGGDLKRCEAMLMGQAQALQSIFVSFARRAQDQEYQNNLESFFRMALKAQNQCRMTLETLATIKNPPVVFAKQANIANGPQQVNNGVSASPPPAHAREEKPIQSNELLTQGVEHGPTLDTGGTAAAGGIDPAMAALEQIDRPANG